MCGFIDFERVEEAASARSALHEAKFADCEIRVEYKVLPLRIFSGDNLIVGCIVSTTVKPFKAASRSLCISQEINCKQADHSIQA